MNATAPVIDNRSGLLHVGAKLGLAAPLNFSAQFEGVVKVQ